MELKNEFIENQFLPYHLIDVQKFLRKAISLKFDEVPDYDVFKKIIKGNDII